MSPLTHARIASVDEHVRAFHAVDQVAALAYVAGLGETAKDLVAAEPWSTLAHAYRLAAERAEQTLTDLTGGASGALLMDRKDGTR